MKIIKSAVVTLLLLCAFGCVSLPNLPLANEIGLYQRGAYILIQSKNSMKLSGELIAVEAGEIIVLEYGQSGISVLSQQEVKKFKVYNAKPRRYGWLVPAGIGVAFTHGFLSVLSFPLTLLITIPVTIGGENSFTSNHRNTPYEDLRMYSRFPQGIPTSVDRQAIH